MSKIEPQGMSREKVSQAAPQPELDVERLAKALRACLPEGALDGIRDISLAAKAIAREYAVRSR